MVALGLAEKSSDVEKMVVDEDGSGEIEFHEFLRIVIVTLLSAFTSLLTISYVEVTSRVIRVQLQCLRSEFYDLSA